MSDSALMSWGKWQQTRNTLALALAMASAERLKTVPGSAEERRLDEMIAKTLEDMQTHSLNGLRLLDLTIADQGLVAEITQASEAARKEADRLKDATEKVDELTDLVTKLAKLVGLFVGL